MVTVEHRGRTAPRQQDAHSGAVVRPQTIQTVRPGNPVRFGVEDEGPLDAGDLEARPFAEIEQHVYRVEERCARPSGDCIVDLQ